MKSYFREIRNQVSGAYKQPWANLTSIHFRVGKSSLMYSRRAPTWERQEEKARGRISQSDRLD